MNETALATEGAGMLPPSLIEAEAGAATEEKGDTLQFLTFSVQGAEYGVNLMQVREIRAWTQVTQIPNSAEDMLGVMNLRGAIIPIFDLSVRFSGQPIELTPKKVVVIIALAERMVGLLTDSVSDILDVMAGQVRAVPDDGTIADERYISGVIPCDEDMVILLDVENVFDASELPMAGG